MLRGDISSSGIPLDLAKVGTIPMLQDLYIHSPTPPSPQTSPSPRETIVDHPCAEEIACRSSKGRRRGAILAKTIGVGIACAALCEFRKPRCPGSDWHQPLDGRRRQCSGYYSGRSWQHWLESFTHPLSGFPRYGIFRRVVVPCEKEREREASIAKSIRMRL
jgi:hypothetical protein